MTISSALSNALSGLGAAARAADLVSANVANALTPGYARRTLDLSSRSLAGNGAGVQIDGVTRQIDQALLADRRLADSALSGAAVASDFYGNLELAIGTPDQPGSLGGRIAGLEAALVAASSQPASDQRLSAILQAGQDLATTFNDLAKGIQKARHDADQQIARDVGTINDALSRIDVLNKDITTALARGADATGLMDQRQLQVDRISPLVPLRELQGERGQIALYTQKGAALLEGSPSVLGFTSANAVTADMTLASGALSGLTLNGLPMTPSGPDSRFEGGALSARFTLRDEQATQAQTDLDALARDLIERFEAPAADPTRAGGPGLFTDAGAAFNAAAETGLSSRIAINPGVDPAQGGALRLLRDGLGATTPLPVGDSSQIKNLMTALQSSRTPSSGQFATGQRTTAGLAADFLSSVGGNRQLSIANESYAAASHDTLTKAELEMGVDTDQEMANLLQIEQAYAANAKVITAVDDMIQTLLRM